MPVPEIDVDELAHLRKGDVPLIDVREPHEYTEFHLPGAVLLPLGQVVDRLDEVPRGETVYVICRSGARSAKAAEHMIANGIDAVNVAGGSLAWRSAGFPVVAGSDPG
jgi:rhodanese-related sulfurtransferase